MPCRLCGKELPLFKKLADTDFCSAEHRELFIEQQQQAMLQRLEESSRRLKRRRMSGRSAFEPPAPPDPNPAPAPLYGFLIRAGAAAEARARLWDAVLDFLCCPDSVRMPAPRHLSNGGVRFAAPVSLSLVVRAGATRPRWHATSQLAEPLIAIPEFPFHSAAGRPLLARLFRSRPKQPVEGPAQVPVPTVGAWLVDARPLLPLSTGFTGGTIRLAAPQRLGGSPAEWAHCLMGAGAAQESCPGASPRFPSLYLRVVGTSVPEELAPPLRFRPAASPWLSTPWTIMAAAQAGSPSAAMPRSVSWPAVAQLAATGPVHPAVSPADGPAAVLGDALATETQTRVSALPSGNFRKRSAQPRFAAPMALAHAAAGECTRVHIPPQVLAPAAECAIPSSSGQLDAPEPCLARIALQLPMERVVDPALSRFAALSVEYPGSAAIPGPPPITGLAPALSQRVFRARPRTGVASRSAQLAGAPWATDPAIEVHALPRLRCGLAGVLEVPPPLTRPLRPRLRGPVGGPAAGQFAPPQAAPSVLWARIPAVRTPAPVCELLPEERVFRFRPRRPAGPELPSQVALAAGRREPTLAAPVTPAHQPSPRHPAPGTGRLFRMRPRYGVNASTGIRVSTPSPFAGRFRAALPTSVVPAPVVPVSTRLFRMRPRGGVTSALLPTVRAAALDRPALPPLWPELALCGCAPTPSARLFRMRPRNPVGRVHPAPFEIATGPAEPSEIFVMPPVPQLHVEYVYELPRPDRPNRLSPPGPNAGSAGPRALSGSGTDGVDSFKVACVMVPVIPSLTVLPLLGPEWRRPGLLERLRAAICVMPRWTARPALRFATCGVAVVGAFVGYAGLGSSPDVNASTPAETRAVLAQVRHAMADRSALDLRDNFSSGLHAWEGHGEWAKTWSYDESGGVKTGQLALWAPTRKLADYSFAFSGQIEKNALGFVVRAADRNNCYAVKLVISRPGPVPAVDIVRYPIVGGKAEPVVRKRLPLTVYNDTIYQVRLTTQGDSFTLSVNEHIVDSWSEPRLPAGAAGFFAGAGERARILSVRAFHQDDTLGKALAFVVKDAPETGKGISR